MTPEVRTEPIPPAGANGTHREPDFLARARRILAGDVRPDDYMPVTPVERHEVDRDLEYARVRSDTREYAPEVAARQLRQRLLAAHYAGQNIAYVADDSGVVVLAVGLDEINHLIHEVPPEKRATVVFTAPEVWW